MEKGLVSIIVPVYNCEKYIQKCVHSILRQTYRKLEVLLIDDESSDRTSVICDQFAKEDKRVKVYHLKNRGVSATRNYGLYRANGEYIQFVDGDDSIQSHMVETLVKQMEKTEADIVICNYYKQLSPWFKVINHFVDEPGIYSRKEYFENTLKDPGHHYYGVIWNKLFRGQVIREHKLFFREEMTLGEDFVFNMQYWNVVERFAVIPDILYGYNRMETRSLSRQVRVTLADCEKELFNRKVIYADYCIYLQQNELTEEQKEKIRHYWIEFYVRQTVVLQVEGKNWEEEHRIYWKKTLESEPWIREALNSYTENDVKQMIKRFRRKRWEKDGIKKVMGVQ